MTKVTIRLKEKESGFESKEIPIKDIIFNQNEIEFEFDKYIDGGEIYENGSLPYKDFLWFKNEYEVIVEIKGDSND